MKSATPNRQKTFFRPPLCAPKLPEAWVPNCTSSRRNRAAVWVVAGPHLLQQPPEYHTSVLYALAFLSTELFQHLMCHVHCYWRVNKLFLRKTGRHEPSGTLDSWSACLYYGLQSQSSPDPHFSACGGMDCTPGVQGAPGLFQKHQVNAPRQNKKEVKSKEKMQKQKLFLVQSTKFSSAKLNFAEQNRKTKRFFPFLGTSAEQLRK